MHVLFICYINFIYFVMDAFTFVAFDLVFQY